MDLKQILFSCIFGYPQKQFPDLDAAGPGDIIPEGFIMPISGTEEGRSRKPEGRRFGGNAINCPTEQNESAAESSPKSCHDLTPSRSAGQAR